MPEPFEYDVFLSFSSVDEDLVRPIWQRLSSNGLRVFWSSASLKKEVGNSWFDVIESSLENSRHFVVVCTPTSMKSKWVRREYKAFSEHCYEVNHRRIVPILAEGMGVRGIPLFMRDYQLGKLGHREFMEALPGLLGGQDLQALVEENERLKRELEEAQNELGQVKLQNGKQFNKVKTELKQLENKSEKVIAKSRQEQESLSQKLTSLQVGDNFSEFSKDVKEINAEVDNTTELRFDGIYTYLYSTDEKGPIYNDYLRFYEGGKVSYVRTYVTPNMILNTLSKDIDKFVVRPSSYKLIDRSLRFEIKVDWKRVEFFGRVMHDYLQLDCEDSFKRSCGKDMIFRFYSYDMSDIKKF